MEPPNGDSASVYRETRRLPIPASAPASEQLLICIDRGGTEVERACTFVRSLVNPTWRTERARGKWSRRSSMRVTRAQRRAHHHALTRDRDTRGV